MARGQIAKTEIIDILLKTFDGAFLYNDGKEVRIPKTEDGEQIQIKITLTCAKDNVIPGADTAVPGEAIVAPKDTSNEINFGEPAAAAQSKEVVYHKPTDEEKRNVAEMLKSLGL